MGRFNPETDYLDRVLSEEPILVGDLILAEILQGFRSDRDFEKARKALLNFRAGRNAEPAYCLEERPELPASCAKKASLYAKPLTASLPHSALRETTGCCTVTAILTHLNSSSV